MIAFEEIGIDLRGDAGAFSPTENRTDDAFRGINPKGKVPVLIVDGITCSLKPSRSSPFSPRNSRKAGLLANERCLGGSQCPIPAAWCATGLHPLITRLRHPQKFCELIAAHDDIRRLGTNESLAFN
jgi:glutathione S-transferase